MSRLAGYWLLSSAAGTAGLILLGGYNREWRAEARATGWKPTSWIYPDTDEKWKDEYLEFAKDRSFYRHPNFIKFQNLYFLDWLHRTGAQGLGVYLGVPLLLFWKKLLPVTNACLLSVAGIGGLMGAVEFLKGRQGKEATSPPAHNSSPLQRTFHQTLGNVCYGLLVWAGLGQLSTSRIQSLAKLEDIMFLRSGSLLSLSLLLGSIATGGLVVNTEAYKEATNWPFYKMKWSLTEDSFQLPDLAECKYLIMFSHQTFSFLTSFSVAILWLVSTDSHICISPTMSLLTVITQVILGVLTYIEGTEEKRLVGHEFMSLVLMTTLLVGLHGTRKPFNINSLK